MTLVGIVVFLAGVIAFGLLFSGSAPEQLAALPMPIWVWLVVAAAGLLVIMLNRRPRD